MKNKKIATGAISLLIVFSLLSTVIALTPSQQTTLKGYAQSKTAGEAVWWIKRTIYAFMSLDYSKEDFGFIINNFPDLILVNPNAKGAEVMGGLNFFLSFIQPLYLLTITVTAFYLIFVSGSPSGRAKAKSLMKSLVVGMIVISLSPVLLSALLNFSAITTRAIMGQADVTVVTDNLQNVFGIPANRGIVEITTDTFLGGPDLTAPLDLPGYLESHTCTLCIMHWMATFAEIELGYYTFLPFMLMIWGMGVYFFLRFAMITLWLMIFPLSMLLYSFETTKAVGRNMLEQTIMWIFLQVFNAVVVVAIALCIIQSKPGIMVIPGIPQWIGEGLVIGVLGTVSGAISLPFIGGVALSPVVATRLSTPLIEFIPFVGCFAILIAPLFIMRLFKGFLP
jgi:hypothetical protein